MSFFLDPPALFILGSILYPLSRRLGWSSRVTFIVGGFITLILFMGGSTLLYLDVIRWNIPFLVDQQGSVWMFHTDITGVDKSHVPLALAVLLLILYPLWTHLGYHASRRASTRPMLLSRLIFKAEDMKSRVRLLPTQFAVVRDSYSRRAVRQAIDQLGGMGKFVRKGDKVMIKVNICGGNPLIRGSFTSIDVADEVVRMVREAGGEPLVCDSDMIWTEFYHAARDEGYLKWAKTAKVPLVNLGRTRCAYFGFPEDSAIGSTIVSQDLIDADVVISVPTMKTHILTTVTLGMKNMYGAFPEKDKAKYHRCGIEQVVFEVARAFTPTLTVIDGSIGGEAYGPLSCRPVNCQTIIASTDVVAADSLAAQLMGYDPLDIVHIQKAHEAGVGKADVKLDFSSLPYKHEKDGKWERPSTEASLFYGALLESALVMPGMVEYFNLVADFFLYGTATLPILRDLTPQAEAVIDDVFGALVRSRIIAPGFTGRLTRQLQRAGARIGIA
ncbi:MAG: DUF362 domain-containing protein [Candidatus Thermoplasmatota archaeon]|nr:DUF362 domain-containing protein [Candidatus Thermoplasmatota archaeon]